MCNTVKDDDLVLILVPWVKMVKDGASLSFIILETCAKLVKARKFLILVYINKSSRISFCSRLEDSN